MAELMGRATGISRGKGGSMHFYDVPNGNFGGDGIVGGHIVIAAGMGYAIRMRGSEQVVVCFFGDGAINEGAFAKIALKAVTRILKRSELKDQWDDEEDGETILEEVRDLQERLRG